jgi:hypothetical protein
MLILILSGVVALVVWCITPTDLKPDDARNSKGELTFWGAFSIVLVQIGLWVLVFFLPHWIIPHLPSFFVTGWRVGFIVFFSAVLQWFALLMILQYGWTIIRATGSTAVMVMRAALGSQAAKRSLNNAPWRFIERERQDSLEKVQREKKEKTPRSNVK